MLRSATLPRISNASTEVAKKNNANTVAGQILQLDLNQIPLTYIVLIDFKFVDDVTFPCHMPERAHKTEDWDLNIFALLNPSIVI